MASPSEGEGGTAGGQVAAHGDHRLAMALAVAGLASRNAVRVQGAEMVAESFPDFESTLARLGSKLQRVGLSIQVSPMTNITHPPLHLGLIGYPLDHSLSPLLHKAALTACGLAGDYHLYPIRPRPAGSAELEALLAQMRTGTLQGLNVTIPHKQTVLRIPGRAHTRCCSHRRSQYNLSRCEPAGG